MQEVYYNNTVNDLIEQQRQTQNSQERQKILVQIQEQFAEDIPYIPLVQRKDYAFSGKGIDGVQITKNQQFPMWTISKS